jgi:predicted RNA-binding protein
MCESTIWLRYPDGRTEKIADDILLVKQEGPTVILRGLMVEPVQLAGTIQEIDSLKHVVTLLATSVPDVEFPPPPTSEMPEKKRSS